MAIIYENKNVPENKNKFEALFTATGWPGRGLDFFLGAICVLGLAPFHLWPIALLGLAALKLRLDYSESPKTAARRGFIFGFGFFLMGTYWIGSAFLARGSAYVFIMPPMILGLALLLAFFWALGGRFYKIVIGDGSVGGAIVSALVFASVFTLAEFTRGHIFTGLPWNLPGYIFPAGGAISQSAAHISIYGLTALTFLMSGLIGEGFRVFSKPQQKIKRTISQTKNSFSAVIILLILLSFVWGYGVYRLSSATTEFVEDVKLRVVQVQFDQSDHFSRESSIAIVNQYISTTAQAGLGDVTHVIWPEGAVSGLAIENPSLMRAMSETLFDVDDSPPVWLLNSLRQETRPGKNNRIVSDYYNSSAAVTFDSKGFPALAAINDKTKLVPFGEFVPFGKWVEQFGIQSLSTAMASISPAKEKENVRFPGLPPVSPQICYEIIFPGLTPRTGRVLPEWILNQSNDAWYGQSIGPHQHFNQARYRAIEERLPIIRAAANGISGSIDSYGRALTTVSGNHTLALDMRLPKGLERGTDMIKIIGFLLLICFVIILSYILVSRVAKKEH